MQYAPNASTHPLVPRPSRQPDRGSDGRAATAQGAVARKRKPGLLIDVARVIAVGRVRKMVYRKLSKDGARDDWLHRRLFGHAGLPEAPDVLAK